MSRTVLSALTVSILVPAALALALVAPTRSPEAITLSADGVVAEFSLGGPNLSVGGHAIGMRFESLGRGARVALDGSSAPTRVEGDVRYERAPGVTEWWRSAAGGLEHGLTIAERPSGEGRLDVAVEVGGSLHVASAADDAAMLADEGGTVVASYTGLVVTDRDGARVPAEMRADSGRIVIGVDDSSARYPLVVDPIVGVEEANLVLGTRSMNDYFGSSVSMSADGTRAVVGASGDDTPRGTDSGSARVYVRAAGGTTWTEEAELIPATGGPAQSFGAAVAMSADGLRVAVGRAGYDAAPVGDYEGGFVVFVRAVGGTTWTEEAAVPGPTPTGGAIWPATLSITSDGSRVLASSPTYITSWGHAIVYRRIGSTWSVEQALPVPVPAGGTYWGYASGISGDGTRLALSLPNDSTGPGGGQSGSVWVYRLAAGTWTFEARLYASSSDPSEQLGGSLNAIALSTDASTMIVGAYQDGRTAMTQRGSATVFTRSGTVWSEEAVLIPPTAVTGDLAGFAASVSADGNRALLGMHGDTIAFGGGHGTAQLFDRVGTTWTHVAGFSASTPINGGQFGYTLALAGDGTRAIVGAPFENVPSVVSYAGSARVVRFENRDANGVACSSASTCLSGFCVDGVCCNAACGANATDDCQACSPAAGGVVAGTCGALTVAVAPTVTCRAPAGGCDRAEICTSASSACPADAVLPVATECRPSAGGCDIADQCNGASSACPTDVLRPLGFECRAALSMCDVAETCDGATRTCPTDVFAAAGSFVCRASVGACDVAEGCTGLAGTCPADAAEAAGTPCRSGASDACDMPDACVGTVGATATCDTRIAASGSPCRSASCAAGVATAAAACDGVASGCPAAVTTDCAPFVCGADACLTGCLTDADCGAGLVCVGSACVPAPDAGPVDAGVIPVDAGSTPTDGGARDTGPRDSGASDAGTRDAGGSPPTVMTGGCACAVPGHGQTSQGPAAGYVLTLLGLVLAARRRAKRSGAAA